MVMFPREEPNLDLACNSFSSCFKAYLPKMQPKHFWFVLYHDVFGLDSIPYNSILSSLYKKNSNTPNACQKMRHVHYLTGKDCIMGPMHNYNNNYSIDIFRFSLQMCGTSNYKKP